MFRRAATSLGIVSPVLHRTRKIATPRYGLPLVEKTMAAPIATDLLPPVAAAPVLKG